MIEITGSKSRFCDGITRRECIRIGSLGLGSLTLAGLLRQRAAAASTSKSSVIFLELAGGPSQFETYDPKPTAPVEYRGPFATVPTTLPGIRFCDLMQQQAKITDRLAIIRSVHHARSSHDPSSHLTQTGYYKQGRKGGPNEMPCIGSVAAKRCGPNATGVPAYVAIPKIMRNGNAAFLGNAFAPFETRDDPNRDGFQVHNLSLGTLTLPRLKNRKQLLETLDNWRRHMDRRGTIDAVDQFTQQAFDLTTGTRARTAFDMAAEPQSIRDRYGRTSVGQGMLLARRLIQAGVTFVTVRVTDWDDHQQIQKRMHDKGPAYDRGVAALVSDLYEQGLDTDVLVVAMGEFGRTPRINKDAGRDHWGPVMSVLMAGGGLKVGQIIGRSTPIGDRPVEAPYHPQDILAMIYRHLGVDPNGTLTDHAGRPRYLLENSRLITELL